MSKTFETREEAAIWMIQHPQKHLIDPCKNLVRWNHGEFEKSNMAEQWVPASLNWGPYTLPEPEPKKEEPTLPSRAVFNIRCAILDTVPDDVADSIVMAIEWYHRGIIAESDARAKRIADERIEAASVRHSSFPGTVADYKLKRGKS